MRHKWIILVTCIVLVALMLLAMSLSRHVAPSLGERRTEHANPTPGAKGWRA